MNKMKTCPVKTSVLLYVQGVWLEGAVGDNGRLIDYAELVEHGCGCCSDSGAAPIGWLPLPSTEYTNEA